MKVSIIIRTKNEERWISSCLESVYSQDYEDFEVILVDNLSEDATVAKARKYPVKLVTIDKFKPGRAINDGIRASSGEILVCLSGHCIPVHTDWLQELVAPLADNNVAGVYGRQEPMSFTTDRDKRDLLTTFGLDPKIQKKDTFFHNANSAFRRDVWDKFPFDEETPHIEDRLWAHDVLAEGMEIHYEPAASVYHYHGVHQDDNPQRRRNIVQILESLAAGEERLPIHRAALPTAPTPQDLNTVALIPVRGDLVYVGGKPLLQYTLEQARKSEFIDRIIVLTDSKVTAEFAKDNGAEAPFLRPKELSRDVVDISEVLKFGIEELERWEVFPDLCLVIEKNYPFRPAGLLDELIVSFLREGAGCAIAAKSEARSIWLERDKHLESISPLIPRKLKTDKFYISLFGLGFVTYPEHIRNRSLGLDKPFLHSVEDPLATLEVRDDKQWSRVSEFLKLWDS